MKQLLNVVGNVNLIVENAFCDISHYIWNEIHFFHQIISGKDDWSRKKLIENIQSISEFSFNV